VIAAEAATALYAYAAVGSVDSALRRTLPPELELIGDDDLAVVVERVSLDEFAEDALRENLNDRDWLEAKARRHEEVVQTLLGRTAVVPLRFGSIHHDGDAVRTFLEGRRSEFGRALATVRGCVELGVKAWLVQGGAASDDPAPSSGRDYLEARRRARDDAAHAAERRAELLMRAHERLLHVSEAGVLNRPQPPELSGRDEVMVMNAAYLVRAGDERLAAEVQRLNADAGAIAFELTGPWAPYNFVETGA
jgi:hypothetical protein